MCYGQNWTEDVWWWVMVVGYKKVIDKKVKK